MSEEKRGLIGDFEYAKRVGEGGEHDVRTVCDRSCFTASYTDKIDNINRGLLNTRLLRSHAGRITF